MANVYYPTIVKQIGESPSVAWVGTGYDETDDIAVDKKIRTATELRHIANPASGPIRDSTYALVYSDFRIANLGAVNGIELRVIAQRNGRITDETIQLTYQDSAIGRNNYQYETDDQGRLPLFDDTRYGGPEDLWGADITAEMLQDPSFGVILKFQSHPYYPHRSGMLIQSVSLTIY